MMNKNERREIMKNKKGISAIVATVMIILITVAAVGIVWAAIIPMIRNQLEGATVCNSAISQVEVSDAAGYTCRDVTGDNVSLQIMVHAGDIDLAGVQVLISAKGNTQSYDLLESEGIVLPGTNEGNVYVIDTSDMAGKLDIDEVQIAPIVAIGNSERVCESSAPIALRDCP
jgi:flagellin-like protein